MAYKKNVIAFDCGNSSYRLVLGEFDGDKIKMEVLAQESNEMVKIKDYYYWDILKIYQFLIDNLKKVVKKVDRIDSIGVCTWGVDFALFDKQGNMLNNPLSYRNEIGEVCLNKLSKEEHDELFFKTGIKSNRINSVYMLSAIKDKMPALFNATDKILMMPDILNYFLTGIMTNEPSELSTTQLFSSLSKDVESEACDIFGINKELFSEIGVHGKKIGYLLSSIKEELDIDYDIPVICVPSHDTASAVMAIPAHEDEFLFISSGTWALIGAELDAPIINKAIAENDLTNEVGAFNKITLLKNSTGMFILERIKKEYEVVLNKASTWEELLNLAQTAKKLCLIDVNNQRFFNPKHMAQEIHHYLVDSKQHEGLLDWALIINTVMESMACNYATTINKLEEVTGKTFDSVYLVGGGSKNQVINKLTAMYTGKKVIIGDKESTCLGNIGTQLNYFDPSLDPKRIRKIIENSIVTELFMEEYNNTVLEQYLNLLKNQ